MISGMQPKPTQWGPQHANMWQDAGVAAAYHRRPEYPPALFDILCDLIHADDQPGVVLDAGCGTGYIARPLAPSVSRVDAVDAAEHMIATGKREPGGDHPHLRWICGPIEDAPLDPPYGLVVAAASIHWLDWPRALPRFREVLTPRGVLAIVEDRIPPSPWQADKAKITKAYSTNQDMTPYDMRTVAEALTARGLFREVGTRDTAPMTVRQSVDHWIESFHARNGLSRERMGGDNADACDARLREMIAAYCPEGTVEYQIIGRVIWGEPDPP